MSLIIRGFSLRRLKEDTFNGELPLRAIGAENHPLVYVKPDDGSKFPHHPETEQYYQKALEHHWRQNGSGRAKKKADRPKLDKHILAEITVAMQAAAHPAVVYAPKFSKKSSRKHPEFAAEYKKWLSEFEQDPAQRQWRSSIIMAMLKIVRSHITAIKNRELGSGGGIVIFARFRPVLDLINIAIRQEIGHGVGCVQFDGRLDTDKRRENLTKFKMQASLEHLVLLTTPKMGGEGHNFTEAACVIMVNPHFNPYVDIQAMFRAVRPGQTRTVHIWRIAMEDSFDVRLGYVQDRKVKNAEAITEWDKRQHQAVLEAEGWTEETFSDEVGQIRNTDEKLADCS